MQAHEHSLALRAWTAWHHAFMPAARTRRMLIDAGAAVVEAKVYAKHLQLLASCFRAWRDAISLQHQRQQAAVWLLQQAWRRGLLADWSAWTSVSRAVKQQVLAGWREVTVELQVKRLKEAAADQLAARVLLERSCRAWVMVWCRAGVCRVMAQKREAASKTAALQAMHKYAAAQKQRKLDTQCAEAAWRRKVLGLGFCTWRKRASCRAGADRMRSSLRQQQLMKMLGAWREAVAAAARKRKLLEAADGLYWTR